MNSSNLCMRLMAIHIILACSSASASVPTVWLGSDHEKVIWRVMGTEYEDAESAGEVIRRLLELDYDGYFFLFCDSSLSVGQLQRALDFLHQLGVRRILYHRIRGTLVEPGEEMLRYERVREPLSTAK